MQLSLAGKGVDFRVSPDGLSVEIAGRGQRKKYALAGLPEKYHKFYRYGKTITEKVRAKTPRVAIRNEDGEFLLMSNEPRPAFEATLGNGVSVFLTAWEEDFRVVKGDVNITKENYWMFRGDKEVQEGLRKAFQYLKLCLRKV